MIFGKRVVVMVAINILLILASFVMTSRFTGDSSIKDVCAQHDMYTPSIARGKKLVQELSCASHDQLAVVYQKEYCYARAHLHAIIDMMHYFDALSQEKNQQFSEGTFIIEDAYGKIYDFLKSYAHTYRRISSHFGEYRVQQYGLDIPLDMRKQILFPQRKRHILFGRLDDATVFIKPENYGTSFTIPTDIIMHTKEYMQYLVRKYMRLGFERSDWREERVPDTVIRTWRDFLRCWVDDERRIAQLIHSTKMYGIKTIVRTIPEIYHEVKQPTFVQREAYVRLVSMLDHYDHHHIRRGTEVILRMSELAP